MSHPPFSPWTPTRDSPSQDSAPSTDPSVQTPRSPFAGTGWSERYRTWSAGTGGGSGMMGFTPLRYGERDERRALAPLNLNTSTTLGLASPFIPADPNSVWGPPLPMKTIRERELTLEEQLEAATKKIRELSIENEQLKASHHLPSLSGFTSPAASTHSSMYFDNIAQGGYAYSSMTPRFEEGDGRGGYLGESSLPSDAYLPPPAMIASVLHGTFNYTEMPSEYMRPIVWVVAHCQPRSNAESAGLKTAVNSLAARLGYPRESDVVTILINSIIEWAKDLCFTSCGNYLCQQLLERGDVEDKLTFIRKIKEDIVAIASDKFGTHVLCKAIAVDELEAPISEALLKHGIFDSLKTGARRLWREYLEKCRQAESYDIFEKVNEEMKGRWAELACTNEHGSIAVQQVFEVYGTQEMMDPCFHELLIDISKIANNQFGHFVVTKLIGYPTMYRATCDAILSAYPPVATTHHGVNFAKIALTEGGRGSLVKYLEGICSQENGRTPGIVAIATSSIGKAHLTFVISCLGPSEHARVRQVCRAYSTTLRNSQSGNDLLRSLGLIHAIGSRHRSAGV